MNVTQKGSVVSVSWENGSPNVGQGTVFGDQIQVVFSDAAKTAWSGKYMLGAIHWDSVPMVWINWAGKYSASSGGDVTLSMTGETFLQDGHTFYSLKVVAPQGTGTCGVRCAMIRCQHFWGDMASWPSIDGNVVDGLIKFADMQWTWVSG